MNFNVCVTYPESQVRIIEGSSHVHQPCLVGQGTQYNTHMCGGVI